MQGNLGKESRYHIIGMMSGTSLDGVDLTCCLYSRSSGWHFHLEAARTYPYPQHILASINVMQDVNTPFLQFKTEELSYSQFISETVLSFIEEFGLQAVDYLSLHGHTIFHRPQQQLTVQVANLSAVAALTRLDVIGNFRELDVLRGGQGAPLAPFGDELFQGDVFINLGGVANIGCNSLGWDVMYCNLLFNHFALLLSGQNYDQGGNLGRKGVFRAEIAEFLEKQWQVQGEASLERERF